VQREGEASMPQTMLFRCPHYAAKSAIVAASCPRFATPHGLVLDITSVVGYKVAGITGAVVAAAAILLPSFSLMLSVLPMFERVRTLVWTGAAMTGVGPAVIGVLAVSLVRMAPQALPDPFAIGVFMGTLIALRGRRIGVIKLMTAGAGLGALRRLLLSLPGLRATF
jgi:chromate transporter